MEVNRQLGDTEYYREINTDPMKHVQDLIKTVLIEGTHLGYITEEMACRITVKTPQTPILSLCVTKNSQTRVPTKGPFHYFGQ